MMDICCVCAFVGALVSTKGLVDTYDVEQVFREAAPAVMDGGREARDRGGDAGAGRIGVGGGHARRKLYDVHASTDSPIAREALEKIGRIAAIEAEINGQEPARRLEVRQHRIQPLLDELKRFLDAALLKISRKSALAGAIRYSCRCQLKKSQKCRLKKSHFCGEVSQAA
jgi:hypothetical protein